jgi:hypothetical protein
MSWEQLRSIVQADAAERAYWDAQPPRACPNDGTPLEAGPGGELHCRHDGFTWPRDSALPGEGGN